MKRWILLVLLFESMILNAQKILLLKDGKKVEFKKFLFPPKGKGTKVKTVTQGNLTFKDEDVMGYCIPDEGKIFDLKWFTKDGSPASILVERRVEGELNLYQYLVVSRTPYSASTDLSLYLSKGDDFKLVYNNYLIKDRKEMKYNLQSFINDNSELVSKVKSEEIKLNEDNIYKIVKLYNISKLTDKSSGEESMSTLFFYAKDRRRNGSSIKIIINDQKEIELPKGRFLPIQLSNTEFSKVCVGSHCEVIRSSPYFVKHVEVLMRDDETDFTEVEPKKAMLYLKNHPSN